MRRPRQDRLSGRGRRAGQVSKGRPGRDRTGVRHGSTVLVLQETPERLDCTKMVQALDVPLFQGAGHNGSEPIAKPHQGAAQRRNEGMVDPIIEDGRELP